MSQEIQRNRMQKIWQMERIEILNEQQNSQTWGDNLQIQSNLELTTKQSEIIPLRAKLSHNGNGSLTEKVSWTRTPAKKDTLTL